MTSRLSSTEPVGRAPSRKETENAPLFLDLLLLAVLFRLCVLLEWVPLLILLRFLLFELRVIRPRLMKSVRHAMGDPSRIRSVTIACEYRNRIKAQQHHHET